MINDWQITLKGAQASLRELSNCIEDLTRYRDEATATIAQHLRAEEGMELDLDAIRATLTRPYTLLPINENEAWLIHWRGVKMPILGWVVAQEPAFIKARVTRSMDLLTPLPAWMKDELGWKPPEHGAIIDGTRTSLQITQGDAGSFRRKYGKFLDKQQPDGTIKIKGGDAWINLVAALVKDGILPYAPKPVAAEHWREFGHPESLRDIIDRKQREAGAPYIDRAAMEFRKKGAVLINYPPGSGKTLTTCLILGHFKGRVLILADTTMLIDQWRDRLALFVGPERNVILSTYQGAQKYLDQEWDLIVFDECQRLPANTFSKLAFVKTKYRIGLTGTAWREDNRQHLIVALSGFPVAIRWAEMITAGVLKKPRIVVATVPSDSAKVQFVKDLVSKRRGRTVIFCDWIQQGQQLADALDVPFVHGNTPRQLEKIQESEVCVVSRIGDRGVSLPDVRLAIEVAGHGAAREQFAQRVGRLLHADFQGEFFTVFTPEEAQKYRARVFGVEAELAGSVDIEFIQAGAVTAETASKTRQKNRVVKQATAQPKDEISRVLALPAISAKLNQARRSVGARTANYIERVMRYCWDEAMSPEEIADALAITDKKTRLRFGTACRAAEQAGLMVRMVRRYQVNQVEIERLKKLSTRIGGAS